MLLLGPTAWAEAPHEWRLSRAPTNQWSPSVSSMATTTAMRATYSSRTTCWKLSQCLFSYCCLLYSRMEQTYIQRELDNNQRTCSMWARFRTAVKGCPQLCMLLEPCLVTCWLIICLNAHHLKVGMEGIQNVWDVLPCSFGMAISQNVVIALAIGGNAGVSCFPTKSLVLHETSYRI